MEVILREDVEKLGSRGDLVKVADGYARNFLLPQKKAVVATDSNRKIVEQEREAHIRREAKLQSEFEGQAKLLAGTVITIAHKVGENDQLFGSVTSADVSEGLAAQGFTIDKRKVLLTDPIKLVGEYQVPVKLHREITVPVKLVVKKEE